MKYRSCAPGQGACLKGMSRTITNEAFTLAAMTHAEKNQRTNGPVNAHLRPEIYTSKITCLTRMVIYMYITPGQGQSNLWSQFLF